MVKIYSDKTNKFYASVEEATKAEHAAQVAEEEAKALAEKKAAEAKEKKEKEAAERKAAAALVEEARKNMVKAQKEYANVLNDFVTKYGSYHYTTNSLSDIPTLFNYISDWL